jgi:hypothetical protein
MTELIETRLKILADNLRRTKAEKWSVVLSGNEIIVRPKDRTLGKFSITFGREDVCNVSFFSRALNYWNKGKYFHVNDSLAAEVKAWMESEAAEPLKAFRDDWRKYYPADDDAL